MALDEAELLSYPGEVKHRPILALHTHTECPYIHTCFLCSGKQETWQEKLLHCGQTWPPITLPCNGIVWQQRGQNTAETFCPECSAARINKSSNLPNLCSVLMSVTAMDLLWQQHRVGLMSGDTTNNTSLVSTLHIHELHAKCDLFYCNKTSVGVCALPKQARRTVSCSLWRDHVGKSWPKYYPELKLTWIAVLSVNAINSNTCRK